MQDYLQQYQRDLALRGYSERTQIVYKGNLKEFLEYSMIAREIPGREKIKGFLYYLIHEKHSSPSKIKQAYSSIRYFYTQTLQQSWEGLEIPRFKKKKNLPLVFSREEVAALLQHSGNLKYKALFSLIYSSGYPLTQQNQPNLLKNSYSSGRMVSERRESVRDFLKVFIVDLIFEGQDPH